MHVLALFRETFSCDEQIAVAMQALSFLDAMFPDGGYEVFEEEGDALCAWLARLYAVKGDREQCFHWLDRHCDFSLYADGYDQSGVHTSTALQGRAFGCLIKEDGMSRCAQNLDMRSDDFYADMREDDRFLRAMERLKKGTKKQG